MSEPLTTAQLLAQAYEYIDTMDEPRPYWLMDQIEQHLDLPVKVRNLVPHGHKDDRDKEQYLKCNVNYLTDVILRTQKELQAMQNTMKQVFDSMGELGQFHLKNRNTHSMAGWINELLLLSERPGNQDGYVRGAMRAIAGNMGKIDEETQYFINSMCKTLEEDLKRGLTSKNATFALEMMRPIRERANKS